MKQILPFWKWFGALLVFGVSGFLMLAILWEITMSAHMDRFMPFLGILMGCIWFIATRYLYRNFSASPAPKTSLWILGFYGLIGLNIAVEAYILPRFGWDNTPKNDWYFQLWWAVVLLWTFFGLKFIQHKILQ